jgi:hypothetical protein
MVFRNDKPSAAALPVALGSAACVAAGVSSVTATVDVVGVFVLVFEFDELLSVAEPPEEPPPPPHAARATDVRIATAPNLMFAKSALVLFKM